MWQSGFLVFPTKPAIFRLACSSSRCKFDAFAAHVPVAHTGFESHSVRLHLASATFCKTQIQAAKHMYVKEDKRRGKKPNANSNSLARGFFLALQPLVAHFKALESTQLGWMFSVMLGDGAIIWMYLYFDATCCSCSPLWAEMCWYE